MRKNHTKIIIGLSILLTFLIAVFIFVAFIWDRVEEKDNHSSFDDAIDLYENTKTSKKMTAHYTIPETNSSEIDDYFKSLVENEEERFLDRLKEMSDYEAATFDFDSEIEQIHDDLYFVTLSSEYEIDDQSEDKAINYTIDLKHDEFLTVEDILNDDKKADFVNLPNESGEPINNDTYLKDIFTVTDYHLVIVDADTGEEEDKIELVDLYDFIDEDYADDIFSDELLQQGKPVAITFDDGPDPEVTPAILKILDEYDVKATFFNLTTNTEKYPEIAKQVVDAGHEIGNHSMTHRDLTTVPDIELANEIVTSQDIIEDATGVETELFRPPYGSIDERVKAELETTNQELAMWTIDTKDWQNQNPEEILNIIKEKIRPGSIILVHDIHASTAEALPIILDYLEEEGYHQTKMSELIPYIENTYEEGYYGKG